ncbi:MAG TPA: hypothetical protein VMZ28_15630 [Kofleriaceae bacterium]|nr:hypothetical protein [Kofleriaceae bacterium]
MAVSDARALLTMLAVLAGGCGFPADTAGRRYRCEAGDACPEGTACVNGYCEQQELLIDGGGPLEVCADGDLVRREDFDQLDEEVWWTWSNGDTDIVASGGALVVSSTVESNGGIIAAEPEQLARLMVSVEVGTRSSQGVGSLAGLQLMDGGNGDTVVMVERTGDQLRAVLYPSSGADMLIEAIDYDAAAQRFWRIVTTDDTASFQYSSVEANWTELANWATTDLPAVVKPQVQSGSFGDSAEDQAFDLLTVCRLP